MYCITPVDKNQCTYNNAALLDGPCEKCLLLVLNFFAMVCVVFFTRVCASCVLYACLQGFVFESLLKKEKKKERKKQMIPREDRMTDDQNSRDVAIFIHSHIVLEYDQIAHVLLFCLFVFFMYIRCNQIKT